VTFSRDDPSLLLPLGLLDAEGVSSSGGEVEGCVGELAEVDVGFCVVDTGLSTLGTASITIVKLVGGRVVLGVIGGDVAIRATGGPDSNEPGVVGVAVSNEPSGVGIADTKSGSVVGNCPGCSEFNVGGTVSNGVGGADTTGSKDPPVVGGAETSGSVVPTTGCSIMFEPPGVGATDASGSTVDNGVSVFELLGCGVSPGGVGATDDSGSFVESGGSVFKLLPAGVGATDASGSTVLDTGGSVFEVLGGNVFCVVGVVVKLGSDCADDGIADAMNG
jgi:hypothetical protein